MFSKSEKLKEKNENKAKFVNSIVCIGEYGVAVRLPIQKR